MAWNEDNLDSTGPPTPRLAWIRPDSTRPDYTTQDENMIRLCLPTGDRHGWGVAGTHLIAELAKLTEIGMPTDASLPLLMAIEGTSFHPMAYLPAGPKQVGYGFLEFPSSAAKNIGEYRKYFTQLICGSSWMRDRMEEIGIERPRVILQGVDYDTFCPAEKQISTEEPFTVFVGGKCEYRKGTDIAIAALRTFMERHTETRAVLAVGNLWPITMRSLEASKFIKYLHVSDNWRSQIFATLLANGLPTDRIAIPEITDHSTQAALYHKAHVGLFPNRCEAGSNLVLCEAIASGLPVIASYATGHTDVFREVDSMLLCNGKTGGEDGWWEINDLEEILAYLEVSYQNRATLAESGLIAARQIREHIPTWAASARQFLDVLES